MCIYLRADECFHSSVSGAVQCLPATVNRPFVHRVLATSFCWSVGRSVG